MGMIEDEGLANAWALYWPPGDPGKYGQQDIDSLEPQAILVNWMSDSSQVIVVDGENYSVSETVYSSSEMKPGGYLHRTLDSLSSSSEDVLAANVAQTPPRDGQIQKVDYQNDLDDRADVVYKAMI